MANIIITTGILPPAVGGPALYAKNLKEAFISEGHKVTTLSYTEVEKALPPGIRHLYFFFRVLFHAFGKTHIIALDTWSVGFPSVLAGKISGISTIMRVGGDFLWEEYVERTKEKIILPNFYEQERNFSLKEKTIFSLTRWLVSTADSLVFSTSWQSNIWQKPYKINRKITIIENHYGEITNSNEEYNSTKKIFLSPGRNHFLKNKEILTEVFADIIKDNKEVSLDEKVVPYDELILKIKNCYAIIIPSLSEISPNLILDGLRFGKPFILTKHNGLHERIDELGLFLDPLNKEDIFHTIHSLLHDGVYDSFKKKIQSFSFKHEWREIVGEFLSLSSK